MQHAMELPNLAWTQLWQLSLCVVFALVATRTICRDRPHWAYALWLVVFIKCIVPPLWSSPSSVFSWSAGELLSTPECYSPESAPAQSPVLTDSHTIEALSTELSPTMDDVHSLGEPLNFGPATQNEPLRALPWWKIIALIWICGFLVQLLVTAVRWYYCWHQIKTSPQVEYPELQQRIESLASRLGLTRVPKLIVTSSRIGPAVIGVLRPIIVIPDLITCDKSPQSLDPILAHELIHIRRGDLWFGLLQTTAKAMWWFHPLVWWISRTAMRDCERCCDEEVIGELHCDTKLYVKSLIDVLELKQTLRSIPEFPGVKAVEVTSQRLERIMRLDNGCHRRMPRACRLLVLLLLAATLPGAAFTNDENKGVSKPASADSDSSAIVRVPDGGTVLIGGIKKRGDSANEPLRQRTYEPQEVIAMITQKHRCDRQQALQRFANLLLQQSGVSADDLPKDSVSITPDGVRINASAQQHTRLRQSLKRMQEYGIERYQFTIFMVTAPDTVVSTHRHQWQRPRPIRGFNPNNLISGSEEKKEFRVADVDNSSALLAKLDNTQTEAFLKALRADPRSNILRVPTMHVFSGQKAQFSDVVNRAFVVDITKDEPDRKPGEPKIEVVGEGVEATLRPEFVTEDSLRLTYDIRVSEIGEIIQSTVFGSPNSKPLELQIPVVNRTTVESIIELQVDSDILLGGISSKSEEEHIHQLVIIQSQRSNLDDTQFVQFPQTSGQPAIASHAKVPHQEQASVAPKTIIYAGVLEKLPVAENPPSNEALLSHIDNVRKDDPSWPTPDQRSKLRIIKEKIADYVDPVKVYPLIGPAQQHHAHYKCTVTGSLWVDHKEPKPHRVEMQFTDVVYVDYVHWVIGGIPPESVADEDLKSKLQQTESLHLQNATLSVWLHAIEELWKIDIVYENLPDDETTLSARFEDVSLRDVLYAVLPLAHCRFYAFDGKLWVSKKIEATDRKSIRLASGDSGAPRAAIDPNRSASRKDEQATIRQVAFDPGEEPAMIPVAYDVADLATQDLARIAPKTVKPQGDATATAHRLNILKALIIQNVAPKTWETVDGPAVIEPYAPNLSLVILQSHAGHRQIERYLEFLRVELGLEKAPTKTPAAAVTTRIYQVADLVVPLPGLYLSDQPREQKQAKRDKNAADYDSLINLIKSTISPDTWADASIEPVPDKLSLAIRQSDTVHQQLTALLTKLRELQEVQITLEARILGLPQSLFQKINFDPVQPNAQEIATKRSPLQPLGELTDANMRILMKAISGNDDASVIAAPKVTVFNGQHAEVSLGSGQNPSQNNTFAFQAVCSRDRTAVRLALAVNEKLAESQFPQRVIRQGDSLFFDITSKAKGMAKKVSGNQTAVPVLGDLPYLGKLFQSETKPAGRSKILIALTPRIIVPEPEAPADLSTLHSTPEVDVEDGGQTLPSPYYLQDDVQYFPAGPEFNLSREAATTTQD